MPVYVYKCRNEHRNEVFHRVEVLGAYQALCDECGEKISETIIQAPVMVKVAQDVHYTSPIDDRPITNWHARQEDLKRHQCVPYDPGIKEDYNRRIKEEDRSLNNSIDEHVEQFIEKLPTEKRGKLYSELTEQGMTGEIARTTKI